MNILCGLHMDVYQCLADDRKFRTCLAIKFGGDVPKCRLNIAANALWLAYPQLKAPSITRSPLAILWSAKSNLASSALAQSSSLFPEETDDGSLMLQNSRCPKHNARGQARLDALSIAPSDQGLKSAAKEPEIRRAEKLDGRIYLIVEFVLWELEDLGFIGRQPRTQ